MNNLGKVTIDVMINSMSLFFTNDWDNWSRSFLFTTFSSLPFIASRSFWITAKSILLSIETSECVRLASFSSGWWFFWTKTFKSSKKIFDDIYENIVWIYCELNSAVVHCILYCQLIRLNPYKICQKLQSWFSATD
jgi:hypothetical protein